MFSARKLRGLQQPIYLIETLPITNNDERQYVVMGTSKKVYNVTINTSPSCDCPDHTTRKTRCKHIYFVLLRIMKVNTGNVDQELYTSIEVQNMFNNIPEVTKLLCVDDKMKEKYHKLKNNESLEVEKKDTDDLCPMCLDDLNNGSELDYCKYSCGKSIHKDCINMWLSSGKDNCLICREVWNKEKEKIGNYIVL